MCFAFWNGFLTRLAEQGFDSYEDVKKWFDEWFASKQEDFYRRDNHKLPEGWEKYRTRDGAYFEYSTFYHYSEFNVIF